MLRRDFQAIEKSADPDHESRKADTNIKPTLEGTMQRGQGQRRSQGAVKRGPQQAAEPDEGGGAAKSQSGDDDNKAKAEHGRTRHQPISLDLLQKVRNWAAAAPQRKPRCFFVFEVLSQFI